MQSVTGIGAAERHTIIGHLGGHEAKLASVAIMTAHPETIFTATGLKEELNRRQGDNPVWAHSNSSTWGSVQDALEPLQAITRYDPAPRASREQQPAVGLQAIASIGSRILAVDGAIMDWGLEPWGISPQKAYGNAVAGGPASRHVILCTLAQERKGMFVTDLYDILRATIGNMHTATSERKTLSSNLVRFESLGFVALEDRLVRNKRRKYATLIDGFHEPFIHLRDNIAALETASGVKRFQTRARKIIGDEGQFEEMRALMQLGMQASNVAQLRQKMEQGQAATLSDLVLASIKQMGAATRKDILSHITARTGRVYSISTVAKALKDLAHTQQIAAVGRAEAPGTGPNPILYSLPPQQQR